MAKLITISTRVDQNVYDYIKEDAEDMEMSLSEWFNNAIQEYIESSSEPATKADYQNMEYGLLEDYVDEFDLDVNPEDYDEDDTEDFGEAVYDAMIKARYEDNPDDDEE